MSVAPCLCRDSSTSALPHNSICKSIFCHFYALNTRDQTNNVTLIEHEAACHADILDKQIPRFWRHDTFPGDRPSFRSL